MIRIERERAFEAALRHTILPEHERSDAGTEAKTRVARPYRRCLGERLERVGEAPMLDGFCACESKCDRILRGARVSRGDGSGGHQPGRRSRESDCQGNPLSCKKGTRERAGNDAVLG